ncbi:hypothetical protein E2562_029315, partial [Oryza meyeriana var. granulata]
NVPPVNGGDPQKRGGGAVTVPDDGREGRSGGDYPPAVSAAARAAKAILRLQCPPQ